MWNSNSRRWLVKDKETSSYNSKNNSSSTHPSLSANNCILQRAKRKSSNVKATKKLKVSPAPCTASVTVRTRARSPTSATTPAATAQRLRVNPCLNQIIEVLLAILLANCLIRTATHMPTALAAFGGIAVEDEEAPSIFSIGGRSSSSLSSSSSNSNVGHRHAHSIGGLPSGFAYNGLQSVQHNIDDFQSVNQLSRSQNFKISPKPCSIGHIEGTCMFVWECIKSEGRHVGMCVDSFMFGSCCAHNYTDNVVLPQFSYTRPTKPMGMSGLNHRPRPPHLPHKPAISGMTTIERPHGAGTLVIRPSGPHHQGALHKPQQTRPSTSTSTSTTEDSNSLWTSDAMLPVDLQFAASITASSPANNVWHTSPQTAASASPSTQQQQQQQHWHMSTEPNFITKPRPPSWEKPTPLRPKPPKPTKKPILPERPAFYPQTSSSIVYSTRRPTKPKPTAQPQPPHQQQQQHQHQQQQPPPQQQYAKPVTTTRPPYTRPTPSWTIIETVPSSSYSTTQSISTAASTTQKHRPTTTTRPTSSASTTSAVTAVAAAAAAPTKTTHRPPQASTPTQRPISAAPSAAASSTTTSTTHPLPPHNLTTIESNEIADTALDSAAMATVKTISAARSECGVPVLARPETRIVGGKSAPFGRWPWQVSVRRTSFFGFSSTHRCGGALINENWIATAGHCVDDLLISQIRIRVGEYDFSHIQEQLPYIERGAAKKVVHPKYNFFTYEYDLALVKLEQPLEFAPHVSPICLPQTDSLLIGMNATVTGWGRLKEGGTLPSVLQEVSVPIVSNDNCKSMFLRAGRQEFIPEIFLCAGYETGGQDSCQGDSGGPLQVKSQNGRFFLAGIISWGIGCAEANLPGVCTRISKFVPWILDNVTEKL